MSAVSQSTGKNAAERLMAEIHAGQTSRETSRELARPSIQYEDEERLISSDEDGYGAPVSVDCRAAVDDKDDSEEDTKSGNGSEVPAASTATSEGARPLKRSRLDADGAPPGSAAFTSCSCQSTSESVMSKPQPVVTADPQESEEIALLREEVNVLEAEIERLDHESSRSLADVKKLEDRVKHLTADKERLQGENARLGEQATKHAAEMQQKELVRASAVASSHQAQIVMNQALNALATHKTRLAELEKARDDVKKQFETYRTGARRAVLETLQAVARAEGVWEVSVTRKRAPGVELTVEDLERVFESAVKATDAVKPLLLSD